jgi:alpha-tubulin suppressor-like RCC1 family protein
MVSVSFFGDTSCALSGAGNVYCWGDNSDGQLGNNTTTNSLTPLQVLGVGGAGFLSNMNYVFAGNAMSCAVSTASNVYCWGGNSSGQLGNNTTIDSHTPVEVLGVGATGFLSGIKTASAGGVSYACALSTTQNVYCWGSNGHGNLGNNTTTDSNTPVEVLGVGGTGFLSNIVSIQAGQQSTCAVSSAGNVYCWGDDSLSSLGDNDASSQSNTPVEVLGVGGVGFLSGITSLGGGSYSFCALSNAQNVYCWGWNSNGQLGNNTTTSAATPVEVLSVGGAFDLSGISSIGPGEISVCAVTTAGNSVCWGANTDGNLGNNSTTDSSTPVEVNGVGGTGILSTVVSVSSGFTTSCSLVVSGNVYCWGDNNDGQLGNNTTTNSSTPIEVLGVGGTGVFTLY